MAEATVESPCISVCSMNDDTGLCIGCYRTIEEIQGWWDLDNDAKQGIMNQVKGRQASVFD